MSDYELLDDLPPGHAVSAAWEVAKANPGKWVRTNLSRNTHSHRRNHPGFDVEVRGGVCFVRWPAPATNGKNER